MGTRPDVVRRNWSVNLARGSAAERKRSRSKGSQREQQAIPRIRFEIDEAQATKFVADNSTLQATTDGLGFRHKKDIKARIPMKQVDWGQTVLGIEDGEGWIKTQIGFLPKFLDDHAVLVPYKKDKGKEKDATQKAKDDPVSKGSSEASGAVDAAPFSPDEPTPSAQPVSPVPLLVTHLGDAAAAAAHARCPISQLPMPLTPRQHDAIDSIFNLMVMICGGPGPTAMKLLEVVADTLLVLSREPAEDAHDPDVKNLQVIKQCTFMVHILTKPLVGTPELGDVLKEILLCLVQGSCCPPKIRTLVMDPLVDIVRHRQVVLESAHQIWVILKETPFHEQVERIYAVGALAAHFEDVLDDLAKKKGNSSTVQQQLLKMRDRMLRVAHGSRWHVDHLNKHSQLYDGALPDCAKHAIEMSFVRKRETRRWCFNMFRSLTTFPKDRRLDPAFDERPVTLTQYIDSHQLDREGLSKEQLTEKWHSLEKEKDPNDASAEDVDSEWSPDESEKAEDAEDLRDFIDCDKEMNSSGIIDPSVLPQSAEDYLKKVKPAPRSPVGLMSLMSKVKTPNGAGIKKQELKRVEGLLQSEPVEKWYDVIQDLMQTSPGDEPAPSCSSAKRQRCDAVNEDTADVGPINVIRHIPMEELLTSLQPPPEGDDIQTAAA
mmetsp:Transcript_139831/g.254368  ORF Transcript_139831/g.254368 Transcript_139831/m.254368 type:complete len:658 (-) Transcript_139831:224-2197(-)